ncbi:PrsW family glutamic-type intramembrane protease [Stieleria magnilauensis]
MLPITLSLLPTLVWVLLWLWIRPRSLPIQWLVAGMIAGALVCAPVYVAETLVDQIAPTDRWSRDFVQQVAGAACCEEFLKLVAVGGLLRWSGEPSSLRGTLAIAASVGIGFMTLENVVAVSNAASADSTAIGRQVSILAGHPSYQVIMGFCLARWQASRQTAWIIAAVAVPVVLHGWGDFSEAVFQDEPNPGSREDTIVFQSWIMSVFVTAMTAMACLKLSRKHEALA